MSRACFFAVPLVALAACAPPGSAPATTGGGAPAAPSAQTFDVGPIRPAQAYLEEPEYASADIERGEQLSLACLACHTLRPGEDHLLGPNLGGIFATPAAAKTGFQYSAALADSGLTWTPPAFDAWLAAPASFVPGTSMVFAGYSAASDRRALIAYLLGVTEQRAP